MEAKSSSRAGRSRCSSIRRRSELAPFSARSSSVDDARAMLEFWIKLWHWLPQILPVLWHATGMTVRVTLGAMVVALLLGLLIALMRISPLRPFRYLALAYTDALRGTPALVQLFIIYFGLSDIGIAFDPVSAAIVGLGINGAAYVGEIYRAGIEALHRGQMEAALTLGMTPAKAMRFIV